MEFKHVPVLLNECIENLQINPDGIYVDGTLGGAGHSLHIAKKLSSKGMLIGIDRDQEALNAASKKLEEFKNVKYIKDNHNIMQINIIAKIRPFLIFIISSLKSYYSFIIFFFNI